MATAMTGPKDVRDQRWLDEQVTRVEDGIDAVILIAKNWTDGRNLARLHPGTSAADYIKAHVGALKLDKPAITLLLTETNLSHRQVGAVAGVSAQTVGRVAATVPSGTVAPRVGADGKTRKAKTIAAQVAAATPPAPAAVVVVPVVQPENLSAFDKVFTQLVARFVSDVTDATVHWSLSPANVAVVKDFTDEMEVASAALTLT